MATLSPARLNTVLPEPWPQSVDQARQAQEELRHQVILSDRLGRVRRVGGVDVSYPKGETLARAAAVVLSFPELELLDQATAAVEVRFPYRPGYLSFREVPAALAALAGLRITPDLIICDGQGLAHPRRFGLACHLGVVTGLPCLGVAKNRLVGEHGEVPAERGGWTPLRHRGEVVGAMLRTRKGVKPVYVSPGHKVGLDTAVELALACSPRYRLPETTRQAHRLAGEQGGDGGRATGGREVKTKVFRQGQGGQEK